MALQGEENCADLKETCNSPKMRPLDFEKTISQLQKMFRKIPMNLHATVTIMVVC